MKWQIEAKYTPEFHRVLNGTPTGVFHQWTPVSDRHSLEDIIEQWKARKKLTHMYHYRLATEDGSEIIPCDILF